jgi:membrane-bound lytic murein transglycosylase D
MKRRLLLVLTILGLALDGCALMPGLSSSQNHPPVVHRLTAPVSHSLSGLPPGEPPPPDYRSGQPPLVHWKDLVFKPRPGIQNLWQVIRSGFRLPDLMNERVRVELNWYAHHPGYMERTANRAQPYLYYILKAVQKRHLPTEIALLPIVESAFDPYADSWAHAAGLWQFIPSTARNFGIRINWWFDGRRDLVESTRSALDFLSELHAQFGSWLLALAAYNSGAVTVENAIQENQRLGRPTDFWDLNLPRATEAYVPRLLAVRDIIAHPHRYGVHLPKIPDLPYLSVVKLKGQIDLGLAARLLGMSLHKLYLLNPGFNRWATDPMGPNRLLVPRNRLARFLAGLHKLGTRQLVAWVPYRVEPGNTLSGLAMQFGTTIHQLEVKNRLFSDVIVAGRRILVPSSMNHLSQYVPFGAPTEQAASVAMVPWSGSEYTVQPGDSLWTIAQRHNVSVADLVRWNHLNPGGWLRPGERLVLGQGAAPEPADIPAGGYYTVEPGDSLWTIANRFGVPMASIARWNDLGSGSILQPGERLRLNGVAPAPETGIVSRAVTYTVRPGDSLWTIARRYNVPVTSLARWNHLAPGGFLHPGERLVLESSADPAPVPSQDDALVRRVTYVVRPGDSLSQISQRFNVTTAELSSWNHVSPGQFIYPGEQLTVYVQQQSAGAGG